MEYIAWIPLATFLAVLFFEISRILWYSHKAVAAGKRTIPISREIPHSQKRILVIGDSTAYGTGASDSQLSLTGRLANTYPTASITNASQNAMDLRTLSEKLQTVTGSFDVILIHIGGIDTLKFTPAWLMKKHLSSINDTIKRLNIPTTVLVTVNNTGLTPIMGCITGVLYRLRSKYMHTFFSEETQKYHMYHVSLYELPGNDPLARDPKRLFSADHIHPNDEGYGIWFSKINATLEPLLR